MQARLATSQPRLRVLDARQVGIGQRRTYAVTLPELGDLTGNCGRYL